MATTYTGLDNAPAFGAGAIISRAYWTVPTQYTAGIEYATELEALETALEGQEQAIRQSMAEPHSAGVSYHPERFYVDLRWDVRFPHKGGSMDTVARRTTCDTLDDAREHLTRLRRFQG